MTRICVSGSAGFIGGYLVQELLARGHDVVGIDNHSKYGPVKRTYDDHPNYKLIEGDARNVELMTSVLEGCEHFVAGAAMMFLVQLPELTFRRTKYELSFDLGHIGVREVFLLAGPRTLSLGAVQLVFFVDTFLASSMPTGSLTSLNYAFQLMLLPMGVFSIAISAAVFPTLSHYASLGQAAKMRDARVIPQRRWQFLQLLFIGLFAIATIAPTGHLWGLHALGYLPQWARVLGLASCLALLWGPAQEKAKRRSKIR